MAIISIRDLYASYGDVEILKGINMDIEENKITAIIGPSGCGKSTLLKSLNSMIEEEPLASVRGEIQFKNKSLRKMDKEEIRKEIGLVFQTPTCFPFSIYKNMIYAQKYYGNNHKEKLMEMVEEKLKIAGLYDEVKDNLNKSALKLSGGQQQRLCIARALTVNPEVILLDEPCSALDIKNTKNIEEMLKKLSKDYTIVIVTHNLSQAKRISHNTAFILNGQLVEYRDTRSLFSNPKDKRTKEYIEGIYG